MVKLINLGYFYSSSPNIISKFREIIELTSSVIWPSANSLGSIECKPIPNSVKYLLCWHGTSSQTSKYPCNCCQTAMGRPCYFTHRFSSVLATVLNQSVKYFDISYFWLPVVSKQWVFTLFILLFYFYPIYLILLLFSLNLCLCFINSHLETHLWANFGLFFEKVVCYMYY